MEHIRDLDKETREIIANDLMEASDYSAWEAGHCTKHALWIRALCLLKDEVFFLCWQRPSGVINSDKDSAYFTIETQRPHLPDEA